MPNPRATVVVPTHNRYSTLATTISSAQAQTVREIEIIIAGDGVTSEVRSIAQSLAAGDPRIKFLDRPKGQGRGYYNRHLAVLAANSDRIFYSDDDDLLFPDHVEKLCAALDAGADIASSAVLSLARSGRVHRSPFVHSRAEARQQIAAGTIKQLFDTHIAHSRALYMEFGDLWSSGPQGVLQAMAASPAVWTSTSATALSIHGSVRGEEAPKDRRSEAVFWRERIGSGLSAADVERQASGVWYLWESMARVRPEGSYLAYQERIGLGLDLFSREQCEDLESAFAIFTGSLSQVQAAERILFTVLEPLLSPRTNANRVARALRRSIPAEAALKVAVALKPETSHDGELRDLLRAELLVACNRSHKARAILVSSRFARYGADAMLALAGIELREKRLTECLQVLEKARARYPSRLDVATELATQWARIGKQAAAAALLEEILESAPHHRGALDLLTKLRFADRGLSQSA